MEILFKGKRADTGEWVQGYLAHEEFCNTGTPYIGYASYNASDWVEVDPDTVLQCAEKLDCTFISRLEQEIKHISNISNGDDSPNSSLSLLNWVKALYLDTHNGQPTRFEKPDNWIPERKVPNRDYVGMQCSGLINEGYVRGWNECLDALTGLDKIKEAEINRILTLVKEKYEE